MTWGTRSVVKYKGKRMLARIFSLFFGKTKVILNGLSHVTCMVRRTKDHISTRFHTSAHAVLKLSKWKDTSGRISAL
jgi:hypothetical protein